MNTDIEEVKEGWQDLGRRLERQHALGLQLFRDNRMNRLRRGLRPLAWGQAIQIMAGIAGALWFGSFWIDHLHEPGLLAAGLLMHLYCLALVVVGAVIESQISRIDNTKPVLEIQRRLLQLRRVCATGGTVVLGLPWWFLYVPLTVVLVNMASGANLFLDAPVFIYTGMAVGFLGMAASVGLYRWAHRPGHERLASVLDDSVAGRGITRTQRLAGELARFGHE